MNAAPLITPFVSVFFSSIRSANAVNKKVNELKNGTAKTIGNRESTHTNKTYKINL